MRAAMICADLPVYFAFLSLVAAKRLHPMHLLGLGGVVAGALIANL